MSRRRSPKPCWTDRGAAGFGSPWIGSAFRKRLLTNVWDGVWVGEKNLWAEDSKCGSVFGFCETQRNLSHSQSRRAATPKFPAVKTGPATAAGTLYRPTKPAASNIGGRRATVAPKFRSYVNSAFSASPATADELTHKPPAFSPESGCARHILRWNRRSAPSRSAAPLTKP